VVEQVRADRDLNRNPGRFAYRGKVFHI
jgi:hypothetical protein